MKLIFAIKSLSTPGGGAERVFVEIVNRLFDEGVEVAVLTFESADNPSFYPLNPSVRRISTGSGATGKLGQISLLPRMRKAIRTQMPDAVIAFMPSSYVPLAAALSGTGIPLIASEHNVPERYAGQKLRWLSMLLSRFGVARYTAVSEQMRAAYPDELRRKMVVVPNPVMGAYSRADVVGSGPGGRLLAVGRLHPQKDHMTLIRAFSMLANDYPKWTLRILGDGSERAALENEVDRLRLNERISLPGTTPAIEAEYAAAQLYVIPSRFESQGLATAEALTHGLPAIGFADCPGTNQLIVDGYNGLLVDPGSDRVAALSQAMRVLMESPDRRLELVAEQARPTDANGTQDVLEAWKDLFRQLGLS